MTDANQQYDVMPKHVAIIMDGNGRWAKQKGKLRSFGHKAGADAVRAAVRFCLQNNIEALTLFAFSSENWLRPADEVKALMELFVWALGSEAKKLNKNNVKLQVIGDLSRFDEKLKSKIAEAEQLTQNNTAMVLNIAANYGGKWDITNACKKLLRAASEQQIDIDSITEQDLSKYIQLNELPDIDLLIRTGGEQRISNFLIWQLAYSELYFCATLWPDFDETAFANAVKEFAGRQRRFGMTGEQIESQH
ncbi:polyprenyl diphosphate synthase [Planctobacterium marinum]|uniref:Ditrans,polycis-undecaprenyl-diphosphate synthase ((2E,6E)-farnesyl-diphosphate specific) n=1 Tax=Planctobacterium marinum TaxID=1631968 RepID=A0AA48I7V7_9ALTE|nr:ditrans,polycis-undecaprenyl-diphosphate synthase [Planctobacterium marinum]